MGTSAICLNGDVTETFQFYVRSRVLGPDVHKYISIGFSCVFTEGDSVCTVFFLVWFFAFCFLCTIHYRYLTTIRNGPKLSYNW